MILWAAALALASPPDGDGGFDPEQPGHLRIVDEALHKTARYCAESFGFTVVTHPGAGVMGGRIKRELAASGNVEEALARWLRHTKAMTLPREADLTLVGAEAILGATLEPRNFEAAQQRYVAAAMAPLTKSIALCHKAAEDRFVAANYLTGQGSTDRIVAELKAMFAEAVRGSAADNLSDGRRDGSQK